MNDSRELRWFDVTTAIGVVLMAVVTISTAPSRWPTLIAVSVLVAAGYLVFGRAALRAGRPTWRAAAFVGVLALGVGLGTAIVPTYATIQAVAHPLVWRAIGSYRASIVAAATLSVAVFFGTAANDSFGALGLQIGALVAVATFLFSVGMGSWVTKISDYGDERARLLDELTAAQDDIAALNRSRGASIERERLARDLHDTVTQSLAAVVMLAERAGRDARNGRTDAALAAMATVESAARDALGEARALVAAEAAVPEDAAFEAALHRLVERFREHGGAQIELTVTATAAVLDRETQVVLLRCVQELLSNARRHSHASRVQVRVDVDAEDEVALEVVDNGRGFDPSVAASGFGLDGLRDRVAIAGGEVQVCSASGAGTRVLVRVPVATCASENRVSET